MVNLVANKYLAARATPEDHAAAKKAWQQCCEDENIVKLGNDCEEPSGLKIYQAPVGCVAYILRDDMMKALKNGELHFQDIGKWNRDITLRISCGTN